MSNRIGKRARRQLVDLRMAERTFGKLGTTATYGSRTATIGELVGRKMIRRIGTSWEDTSTGGKIERTRYALTDRGRVVADQLVFNLKTARSASDLLDDPDLVHYRARITWRKSWRRHHAQTETHELRFRGDVGLRVWPAPDRDEGSLEYQQETARLGMAPPRSTWNESTRSGYEAIRERNREIRRAARPMRFAPNVLENTPPAKLEPLAAAELRAAWEKAWPNLTEYRDSLVSLIPRDVEPLDRVIAVLDSGYGFVEDAHRRVRQLEAARLEHDDGDADDDAIPRAIKECERQLRMMIVGNGHLHAEPMLLTSYAISLPYTVTAHALEAARRQPLALVELMRRDHDDAEERAEAAGYGLFALDRAAETRKDGDK